MKKLALNFICKNERPVIERMLRSALPVTDLIVVNDTGSTDGTQDLIRRFGEKHNIPTYVFERPFDDFGSSRQYALDMLKQLVAGMGWPLESVWGFWIDCDERLILSKEFDRSKIDKDLHLVMTHDGNARYLKTLFFRLSVSFQWVGPIHETLLSPRQDLVTEILDEAHVVYTSEGHSWKGDLSEKYKHYAAVLEGYSQQDSAPRWVFYCAQSYMAAANYIKDDAGKRRCWRKAEEFYARRVAMQDENNNEQYFSQYQLALIASYLGATWVNTKKLLLEAYYMSPKRGEAFQEIIHYYFERKDWRLAYFYSSFTINTFHGKVPAGENLLFLDESLYRWRFLFTHYLICRGCGETTEAKACYEQLMGLVAEKREFFQRADLRLIFRQSPALLNLHETLDRFKERIGLNLSPNKRSLLPGFSGAVASIPA